jgi:hypothetical protein
LAARDPPPGTGGTARSKQITQKRPRSAPTLERALCRSRGERKRRRRAREAYPVGDHFGELARQEAAATTRPKPKRGEMAADKGARGGGGGYLSDDETLMGQTTFWA